MYILFVVAGLVFFEKGRINLLWFMSYLPFLLVVIFLTTTYFGWTTAFELPAAWETIVDISAVLMCCLAISLYILYFFGALLIAFNWYMLVVVIFGIGTLNYTARQEEKQLLRSTLSSGYGAYMKTTGRFFPRLFR
jgi:protein-S-isoprenylcysteine O-methyltransferase Ste14